MTPETNATLSPRAANGPQSLPALTPPPAPW
jgi:hypothetical protein